MPALLRNALAVLAGHVIGGAVNSALITLGPSLTAPPAGVDMGTTEGLGRGCTSSSPGTSSAPAWFIALDLAVAYLPMAWLAIHLGRRVRQGHGRARLLPA